MVALVIVLALVATVAVVVAAGATARLRATRREADAAIARADLAEQQGDALAGRVRELESNVAAAENRADALGVDLESSKADLGAARTELDSARSELEGLRAELDGVRAELDELRARPAGTDASSLWELAVARQERAWALGMGMPPEPPKAEPVPAAFRRVVERHLDALRDDVGLPCELTGEPPADLDAPTATVALATLEEVVAAAARRSEGVTVALGSGPLVRVTIHGDRGIDLSAVPGDRLAIGREEDGLVVTIDVAATP